MKEGVREKEGGRETMCWFKKEGWKEKRERERERERNERDRGRRGEKESEQSWPGLLSVEVPQGDILGL